MSGKDERRGNDTCSSAHHVARAGGGVGEERSSSSDHHKKEKDEEDDDETAGASMLAQKLTQLSMDDREQVFYDLHGISELREETPELLEEKLARLEEALQKIPSKSAYDFAYQLEPEKLQDRDFRLKFLRATSFDAEAAAKRMTMHLDQKRALFGDDKILKDITWSELGSQEHEILELCWTTILPLRDRARRMVLASHPFRLAGREDFTAEARLRVLMYLLCPLADDVENQRRGVVHLLINMEPKPSNHIDLSKSNSAVGSCLPIRTIAVHMFEEDTQALTDVVPSVVNQVLDKRVQVRIRKVVVPHNDYKQIHFILNTYGIPVQTMPTKENGDFDTTYHKMLLDTRKASEASIFTSTKAEDDRVDPACSQQNICTPGFKDVLLGKDSLAKNHVGNVRYLSAVRELFPAYDATDDRLARRAFFESVLNTVYGYGGRFLRRDDSGIQWQVISREEALEKIGNSFRSFRRNEKRRSSNHRQEEFPNSNWT